MPLLYHVLGLGDPDASLAACRARAAAAADPLRGPHHHRAAPGAVAAADHRRGPALGRCRVARGAAFRHGPAGAHAADAAWSPIDRRWRTTSSDSSRVSHTALRLSPLGRRRRTQRCWRRCSAKAGRAPPGDLRDQILERAGGNPLFIEEIVRGLIELGVLKRDGQQWRIASRTRRRPAFRPPSRRCCSPASTGCRRRCAGWPRRPRSSARASTRRCSRPSTADPARLEAGLELLCDAEIIEEVAGAGLDLVARLPLHADAAAGRDLSEPAPAAAHRNARADRRRLRAPVRRQPRAARGSDRCSAIISA